MLILKPGQTKGFLPYLGGTAQYRAPESKERQKQGHFYSFETDVYSLMKIFKDDLGLKLDELGERPPVKDLLSVLLTKLHMEACENPDNPNTKQYHQYYFNTKTLEQAASYHHLTKEQIITLNFLKNPSEASLKDVINIFNHPEKSSSFKLKTFFKKSKLSHSDYNKLEDIFKFKELEKTKDLSGFILSISKQQQKFSIVNQFVQTTIALTAIAHQAPTAPQAQVKMKL